MSTLLDDPTESTPLPPKQPEITWRELAFGKYRKSLYVGIMIGIFHQTTGISAVTFFSNEIFTDGRLGQTAELAARFGTFSTGVAGVFAAFFGMYISKFFGRRTIILGGEVVMCVLLALLAFLGYENKHNWSMVVMVAFVFVFNGTFGSMLWLYISEILGAKGISVVAFFNLLFTVFFGSAANIFFELMSPAGVYLLLFFIQIGCIAFFYLMVKETRGRSKEECDNLYVDKASTEKSTKVEMSEI